MAFKPLASHTESLQALACAVRQDSSGDISAADVAQAMTDLGGNKLESSVKKSIKIDDGKMGKPFLFGWGIVVLKIKNY